MRSSIVIFIVLMSVSFMRDTDVQAAVDPCLSCHEQKTPGIVGYWKGSAHYGAKVYCVKCHGDDVEKSHKGEAVVDASVCGGCHGQEYREHEGSRHSLGMKTGQGCTRNLPESREKMRTCSHCHERGSTKPIADSDCAMFLAQSPEMQRRGCSSCHRVEQGCDSCHTRHGTDTSLAGLAGTCGTCHMGPDHAQFEMWSTSAHGVIYEAGGAKAAPTCVTCHMDGGTHNISQGIATGRPSHLRDAPRQVMLDICARCHTRAMAARSMQDADAIESQSRALVDEARQIVEALGTEGLLVPDPAGRDPHPLFGQSLVTGPHMLYEGLSSVEAKYFRMKKFYYISAFKGAFHQNPDYAHWYGNAPLKLALSEIESDAAALREAALLRKRMDNLSRLRFDSEAQEVDAHKHALRELNERLYKGEITEEEHRREKKHILDSLGL